MKGYILEQNYSSAEQLIAKIDTCMGFPSGGTTTWQDGPLSFCSIGATSAYTEFEAYAVKVDTDQMSNCLTPQEIASIVDKPIDWNICQI